MTVSFEQLIAEHDALEAQAAAILRMCDGALHPEQVSIALDRLACDVDDHIANEDGLVYPVATSLRTSGHEADGAMMTEQLTTLRADWHDYLAMWTLDRIRVLPDRFARDTAAMMPRLRERVRIETEMLYAAALHQGLLPLRARRA